MQSNNETLWGAKAIANFIGRSVDTVYTMADDPKAPVYKPGGRYCGIKSELMSWIRTKPIKSQSSSDLT
jgi:hypothetical protein